jgi:hypothetical protein
VSLSGYPLPRAICLIISISLFILSSDMGNMYNRCM